MAPATHNSRLDRMGASLGLWAVGWFLLQYIAVGQATAVPEAEPGRFIAVLGEEAMIRELVTFFRVVGAIVFIWFMSSVLERCRLVEGTPGRLSYVVFSLGILWGGVWLISAFLNSAAVTLAIDHGDSANAQLMLFLSTEILAVLTAPIFVALTLAMTYVGFRFSAFMSWYRIGTGILSLVLLLLALVQWYGPGDLGPTIMGLCLAWIAATSLAVLVELREEAF